MYFFTKLPTTNENPYKAKMYCTKAAARYRTGSFQSNGNLHCNFMLLIQYTAASVFQNTNYRITYHIGTGNSNALFPTSVAK